MRKLSEITTSILPAAPAGRSYDRRPLPKVFAEFTCLVLIKHHETEKALLVSDDGDAVGAVWIPKAMVGTDKADRGRFLVVTVSQTFLRQKSIFQRFIDPERFTPDEAKQLFAAEALAARTRQRLRGDRPSTLGYMGRNQFA